jgi:hypothetical protein
MDHKSWHKDQKDILLWIVKVVYAFDEKEILTKW